MLVLPQATNPSSVLAASANLSWLDEMASGKRFSRTKTSTLGVEIPTFSDTEVSTAPRRVASAAGDACSSAFEEIARMYATRTKSFAELPSDQKKITHRSP